MAEWDDLTLEDRQAVQDFASFLEGGEACLICLTPSSECERDNPCCGTCVHGRLQRVEGPPRTESGRPPHVLLRSRQHEDGA